MSADTLNVLECRIVGSLIEKELTTPQGYPLSLNALVAACNQKSNREPRGCWVEREVDESLSLLLVKGWVTNSDAGGRVLRWLHRVRDKLEIDGPALAVLAELLLRGPQQPGALRARAARMHPLPDQAAVKEALAALARHEPPLVSRLERVPGERADRFGHTLAGADARGVPAVESGPGGAPDPPAPVDDIPVLVERVGELEREVSELRSALEELLARRQA